MIKINVTHNEHEGVMLNNIPADSYFLVNPIKDGKIVVLTESDMASIKEHLATADKRASDTANHDDLGYIGDVHDSLDKVYRILFPEVMQ